MPEKFKKTIEATKEKQMTLSEAKAFRASSYKPVKKPMTDDQKREAFRVYWVSNKSKYNSSKSLEKVIWLHLKTIGMNSPEDFQKGIENFGLKKIK